MSVKNFGPYDTYKAGSDLSAKRYYAVKLTADDTVDLVAASTDKALGVLDNTPVSGANALVHRFTSGTTFKGKLGGSVNRNDDLMVDTDGRFIAAATTGNRVVCRAKVGGVANDVIELVSIPERLVP